MTTETLTVAETRTRRDLNSAPYVIQNSATPPSMRPGWSSTPEFGVTRRNALAAFRAAYEDPEGAR
jgi:hypothetical protein